MKKEIELSVAVGAADLVKRLDDFLGLCGYQKALNASELTYQRGSQSALFIGGCPNKLFSEWTFSVTPSANGVTLKGVLKVNSMGQLFSPKDRAFWQLETDELMSACQAGSGDAEKLIEANKSAALYTLVSHFSGISAGLIIGTLVIYWLKEDLPWGVISALFTYILVFVALHIKK